jgi:hypothetical protein
MKFIITSFIAIAATVSAAPMDGPKPGSIAVNEQCGSQILSCCNTYNIEIERRGFDKRDDIKEILEFFGDIVGLFGDKTCYKHEGTVCSGVSACCPGNGNEVSVPYTI